eukprot:snap_masked-scaffold_21-processed-gene-1.8-mRNA-1 protein AED:1.00 eAED:1.00 QI:0/0/0/0/1/1/2/0/82
MPKKPFANFSMFQSACKKLCEEDEHRTDEDWRKAYATIIEMKGSLKENPNKEFSDVILDQTYCLQKTGRCKGPEVQFIVKID